MFKKVIAAALIAAPIFISAADNFYYHSGKKVVLTENYEKAGFVFENNKQSLPRHFESIVSKSFVRSNSLSLSLYEFDNLTSEDVANLSTKGVVAPSYRFSGAAEDVFVSSYLYAKLSKKDAKNIDLWLKKNNLTLVKKMAYIDDWFIVSTSENAIDASRKLVESKAVLEAEPSFFIDFQLMAAPMKPSDELFPKQWHLYNDGTQGATGTDSAHVAEAWTLLQKFNNDFGKKVVLSIIDNGFQINHPDLNVVDFKNLGQQVTSDIFNSAGQCDSPTGADCHGTGCAGVAAAKFNNGGVAGACPECGLLLIRMDFATKQLDLTAMNSFNYAIEKKADIVSCSWGPNPAVNWPMPVALSELLKRMAVAERGGKGMIILFAGGNGDPNTGQALDIKTNPFAVSEYTLGIGATNAQGIKAIYSNFGAGLDVVGPSNDFEATENGDGWAGRTMIDGIWTTDLTGAPGYAPGNNELGDATGNYTNSFGGTSSATPLIAGIVGIILAANPALTFTEVREILITTADKTGPASEYNAEGFSINYGYGRINAEKAVAAAIIKAGGTVDIEDNDADAITPDNDSQIPVNDDDLVNDGSSKNDEATQYNDSSAQIKDSDSPATTNDSTTPTADSDNVIPIVDEASGCGCSVI